MVVGVCQTGKTLHAMQDWLWVPNLNTNCSPKYICAIQDWFCGFPTLDTTCSSKYLCATHDWFCEFPTLHTHCSPNNQTTSVPCRIAVRRTQSLETKCSFKYLCAMRFAFSVSPAGSTYPCSVNAKFDKLNPPGLGPWAF